MQSVLTSQHYFSEDIFDLEKEQLFKRLWNFVTFRTLLSLPNSFVTREIGGVSILIQNVSGEIKAFENCCPHRLMPIQQQPFGQSRMVCRYHGWVFDGAGQVKTIPNEDELYCFNQDERNRLCLSQFQVTSIGNLVFVNLSDNPLSIDAQYSKELQAQLIEVSRHFSDTAIHNNIDVNYNWKLNYENVLDHNHLPYVHPKSFLPLLRKVKNIEKAQESISKSESFETLLTLSDQSFSSTTPLHIESWPWHSLVDRYGPGDLYYNFFLFPNINFISLGGIIFLAQQFQPISATKTQVRFTLTTAKEKKRIPALPAILRGHMKAEVEVLLEDVKFLEAIQSNLHLHSPSVQHGQYEYRLAAFGNTYKKLLKGDCLW